MIHRSLSYVILHIMWGSEYVKLQSFADWLVENVISWVLCYSAWDSKKWLPSTDQLIYFEVLKISENDKVKEVIAWTWPQGQCLSDDFRACVKKGTSVASKYI